MKKLYSTLIAIFTFSVISLLTAAPAWTHDDDRGLSQIQRQLNQILQALRAIQNQPNFEQGFPTWDQILPANERFILVMSSNAVLDRETGLVWEKSPDTQARSWLNAQSHCNGRTVGNRKGWRLPTIQELASLVDPSVASPGPTLSAGHPFTNVQSSSYWSATTFASSTSNAWDVIFSLGVVNGGDKVSFTFFVWCVRGGQGVDPQ